MYVKTVEVSLWYDLNTYFLLWTPYRNLEELFGQIVLPVLTKELYNFFEGILKKEKIYLLLNLEITLVHFSMFDYQSIAYYIHVLNHKLNTYSNWRIKIWTLHTLNKSNIKVHESFKKVCILIVQMLLFSARTKTKQSKVGTIKNPANLEKKASTQWAVSSPLADLSFHIPVLLLAIHWYDRADQILIYDHQMLIGFLVI